MVLIATQVKRRRGTTAENDAFTGAEGEITVDTEKHQLRVHDGTTQGGFVIGSGGSGRNVGDIFFTKRTDTELAGAVDCDGATYNTEDYEGAGSIGELLEADKLDYISLTDYATAISTKGWCGSIGWNGTGTTSFRVPTISPRHYIIKSQEPTAENNYTWYRLYADGWIEQGGFTTTNSGNATKVSLIVEMADSSYTPLIQGRTQSDGYSDAQWQVMPVRTTTSPTTTTYFYAQASITGYNLNFKWQVSGMSNITPESGSRVMIQLFNGATDEAVATCTEVLADVANLKDHRVIAFQEPTANNNYTWYRKYADGWIEQGGRTTGSTYTTTITFPVAFTIKPAVFASPAVDSTDVFFITTKNVSTTGCILVSGLWQSGGLIASSGTHPIKQWVAIGKTSIQ